MFQVLCQGTAMKMRMTQAALDQTNQLTLQWHCLRLRCPMWTVMVLPWLTITMMGNALVTEQELHLVNSTQATSFLAKRFHMFFCWGLRTQKVWEV